VLRVLGVKSELLVEFTGRRLLRRFIPLYLPPGEGDLPAVTAALRPLNQQHLAVKWVRINALATTSRAAAPERHRWHQQGSHHCNAGVAARRWIEVDRLKAWESERRECLWERNGECGETPRRIATERLLNTVCESVNQRDGSARPARCAMRAHGDPRRTRRAVVLWERLRLAAQRVLEHLADRLHRDDLQRLADLLRDLR